MSAHDGGLAFASYFYLLVVVGAAEAARRGLRADPELTRKAVHAALSLWSVPLVVLFEVRGAGLAMPATFLLVSWLSFRFGTLRALEDAGPGPGSVLYAASYVSLLWLLWTPGAPGDLGYLAVAGILTMGLGDSAARLAGRRLGTRRLRVLAHSRTMEGMLALFLVSGGAMALVLALLGGLDGHQAVAFSLIAATLAACIEPVSPYGTDNVSVPFTAAGSLYALVSLSALGR